MKDLYLKTEYGNMYYEVLGKGRVIVFLHGWGKSSEEFRNIANNLSRKFTVVMVDFLGFGLSDFPNKTMSLFDYVKCLRYLVNYLNIRDIVLVGHSFGGRVAILYSSIYKVSRLVLVNSAGIKHRDCKYYWKVINYKFKKFFYFCLNKKKYRILITSSGSNDYINTDNEMKKTFKKVVGLDLTKYLSKINTNTYIIAGVNDQTVDYNDALLMNELIAKSKLFPFFKSGHFTYQDEENKFINLINRIGE